jgi:hypothetical protein
LFLGVDIRPQKGLKRNHLGFYFSLLFLGVDIRPQKGVKTEPMPGTAP